MAEKGGFVSGLFKALILAIISFVVLIFLFPNIADKNLGYSYKNGDAGIRSKMTNQIVINMKASGASDVDINTAIQKIKDNIPTDELAELVKTAKESGAELISNTLNKSDFGLRDKINTEVIERMKESGASEQNINAILEKLKDIPTDQLIAMAENATKMGTDVVDSVLDKD